jgi:hypothetical protein
LQFASPGAVSVPAGDTTTRGPATSCRGGLTPGENVRDESAEAGQLRLAYLFAS